SGRHVKRLASRSQDDPIRAEFNGLGKESYTDLIRVKELQTFRAFPGPENDLRSRDSQIVCGIASLPYWTTEVESDGGTDAGGCCDAESGKRFSKADTCALRGEESINRHFAELPRSNVACQSRESGKQFLKGVNILGQPV